MKKILCAMCVLACAWGVVAETATVGDCTWTYEEVDGIWKIKSVSSTTNEITVPSALGGKYISTIASNAFYHCHWLKSAKISVGITNIEEGAFRECKYLKSISLPYGLTKISWGMFAACTELNDVVLPASITEIDDYGFNGCTRMTHIELPESITRIGRYAFWLCSSLESVELPSDLKYISKGTFLDCTALTNVVMGSKIMAIGDEAFGDCVVLKSITLPKYVDYMGNGSFQYCTALESIDFEGWPPTCLDTAGLPLDIKMRYNVRYIDEWAEAIDICGYTNAEAYYPEEPSPTPVSPTVVTNTVAITVTNVVVHYVFNSIQPQIAVPATVDTGIVNIITEVKGGAIAVPAAWADNYPTFVAKFGSDFTKALAKPTGKKDGSNNDMLVWQDYVAGTDPTNEKDVFKASITIVNNEVLISYTPELTDEQKKLRKYTTWGKKSILDENWVEVESGMESNYNFFKVSVEML